MILDFQYWWKQFNGPRITAIMRAILLWMKENWDEQLEYFWNLSIDTANSSHLTFFGILSGFIRPIVTKADEEYFYFSEAPPTKGSSHGLSYRPGPPDLESEDPYEWGGPLSEVSLSPASSGERAPTEWYRQMLAAWSSSKGIDGSLELLDDLTSIMSLYDSPLRDLYYIFTWSTALSSSSSKTYGDIDLDLDNPIPWNNPFVVEALFSAIAASIYTPVPRLYPILEGVDSSTGDIAKRLLQFLSEDDLYISQVCEELNYELTADDFPDYKNEEGLSVTEWNTEKDGSGDIVSIGYILQATKIQYAYPVAYG